MKSDFRNIDLIFFGLLALWFFFLRPIFSRKKEPTKSETPPQIQRASSEESSSQELPVHELPKPSLPPVPLLSEQKTSLKEDLFKEQKTTQKKVLSQKKLREAIILSEILKKPYLD